MSIVMIRVSDERAAEEPDPAVSPRAIPDSIQRALSLSAANAGQLLVIHDCANEDDAVERLRGARGDNADIVLFDPGRSARRGTRVGETLAQMPVPYIEVHDDRFGALEPVLEPTSGSRGGRRVGIVNGYASQSYTLALWMALDVIGCADSANDIHVGT